MVNTIKKWFEQLAKSRLFTLSVIIIALMAVLVQRLFVLQIVNGESYLNNYTLLVEKERELAAARGNIYDRNGNVLAYNELAYSVVIEDNGTYDSPKQRSKELNAIIAKTITILESRGDATDNDFNIDYVDGEFEYTVSGTARLRFLADIFGRKTIDELSVNTKLGFNEATASARQVMEYIMYNKYEISDEYDERLAYEIAVVRNGLSANYYRKYISTTIATDVSDETVAAINENLDLLQGVSIEESTLRKYVDSEFFCHITGYTGKISQAEYDELSENDDSYTLNDYIGKSGIESVMEADLKGTKGRETFYVDNLGKVIEVIDSEEPVSGNDVYLSIDKDLQKTVYDLLEQEIAGILYSSIANIKSYHANANSTSSDVVIPIYDVYFALLDNNVINIDEFAGEDAMENEKQLYQAFRKRYNATIKSIKEELTSDDTVYGQLDDRLTEYVNYIVQLLIDNDILLRDEIDKEDEIYQKWKAEKISLKTYLKHCISQNWIDITSLSEQNADNYSDSSEIYKALVEKLTNMLEGEKEFHKLIYKYMIKDDTISGRQICLTLYEQDVLANKNSEMEKLQSSQITAYEFLKKKIKKLEITPAQLALDPCSGSCVVIEPSTGEVLACVSYPGYDNNKLANVVDSEYYNSLLTDNATPLYDYATQQETAPGSTFKPLMSAAGLSEGIISPSETIHDDGVFEKISNEPKCWLYRSNRRSHGDINVSEALRDSCNYFFYEVGYRMSVAGGNYNDSRGIKKIRKYVDLFGLSEKTGIEIPESEPNVADEFPVMAAIGQSNHSYTTIGLARYITAIANSGTVYNLTLLDSVATPSGEVVKDYHPEVKRKLSDISRSSWLAIQNGMRMVCESSSVFQDVSVTVAGKTGTAQQIKTRPSHALFVGYAPYNHPTMAIVTRIPYGYSSANAAEVSANVIKYYIDHVDVVNGQAADVNGGTSLD